MLLALGAILLVAIGILIAWFLTHRHNSHPVTTTVTTPSTQAAIPKIAVPNLVGMSFADARTKLDALGLASAKTTITSDKPAGTVVDQAPKPGASIAKGSTVTLSIAQSAQTTSVTTATASTAATTTVAAPPQPQNATMPSVQGQTEPNAVQAMGTAGILASIVFVPKPQEQVPNVIGRSLTEAVSAMQGAHLRLIYLKFPVTTRAQAGKIVQQSPLGGNKAPENAQVLVYLGAFQQ